jgi:hypothetical protein
MHVEAFALLVMQLLILSIVQMCPMLRLWGCRLCPILRGVREEARDGTYTLVLEFQTKEQMTLDMWESRLSKIESFFGPGVTVEVRRLVSCGV